MNSTAISNLQQNGTYFLKPVGNITLDAHIGQFNLWAKEYNVDNFGNPLVVSTSTIKDFFDHLLLIKINMAERIELLHSMAINQLLRSQSLRLLR